MTKNLQLLEFIIYLCLHLGVNCANVSLYESIMYTMQQLLAAHTNAVEPQKCAEKYA